jgi:hypothetical protein
MSNIFLKNGLSDIFDSITESKSELPKFISIIDNANKTESATSTAFVGQTGGNYSATSASEKDVNKLISMLTSESSSANFKGLSETSTASLENQLRDILNQDGGAKKKKSKKQKGGANVDEIKQFFATLKSQGVNVDVKLNNKTMSEFFGQSTETTTEMPVAAVADSATSSANVANIIGSATSEDQPLTGGAWGKKKGSKKSSKKGSKKGGAKKSSKKSSKKGSKKSHQDGGVNAGFQAFLDLKKHIAEKLGISNGPQAAKVAGAVQKEMKEKHPDLDAVKVAEEGRKHFDKNVDHYKQMLTK